MDNYILRITNTSLADGVTVTDTNSAVEFETPSFLRKKGKCKIKVISGNINLCDGADSRINDEDASIFCLTSNIQQLGYFTETRGANTVLGECATIYKAATALEGFNAPFNIAIEGLEFTCQELPPVIKVQRMVYNGNVFQANTNASIVPFQVTLDIRFFEDMEKK